MQKQMKIALVLTVLVCLPVGMSVVWGELHNKIALATEGKAEEVAKWYDMFSLLKFKYRAVLFLLSYDRPIDNNLCNNHTVVCQFGPNTTWTSGRNALVRTIAQYQSTNDVNFKYWLFGDQDMAVLKNCGDPDYHCRAREYPPRTPELAACCFDVALDTLLAPEVQYAMVSFVTNDKKKQNNYLSFAHWDCNDGALTAVHNTAVPVFLPYVELIDEKSWYGSWFLSNHVIVGCFPGYSVYSNIFSQSGSTSTSTYPTGKYPELVQQALLQVYGKLGLIPSPMRADPVLIETDNCANLTYSQYGMKNSYEKEITAEKGKIALKTLWLSNAWQNTSQFQRCHDALVPRYTEFIETGDLAALDGKLYA